MINAGDIIIFLSGEVCKRTPRLIVDLETGIDKRKFDCQPRMVENGFEYRFPITEINLKRAQTYFKRRGYLIRLDLRSFKSEFPIKEQKEWFDKDLKLMKEENKQAELDLQEKISKERSLAKKMKEEEQKELLLTSQMEIDDIKRL